MPISEKKEHMEKIDELLAEIDVFLRKSIKSNYDSERAHDDTVFDLERELYNTYWFEISVEAEHKLDLLRKKIEVTKKIHRFYMLDMSNATVQTNLCAEAVKLLYLLFLKAALERRDFRYLNTALKISDGILGREDCLMPKNFSMMAYSVLEILACDVFVCE